MGNDEFKRGEVGLKEEDDKIKFWLNRLAGPG